MRGCRLFISLPSLSHLDPCACAYSSRGSVSQASGPGSFANTTSLKNPIKHFEAMGLFADRPGFLNGHLQVAPRPALRLVDRFRLYRNGCWSGVNLHPRSLG